ncbi:RCC1 domain-containing protein [Legionella drozanskii]|uniref:Regulator of chromosome condensation (RCC1) repeat protein n=1 Tax=Legionella drozanskii LLAP-1 TaxID=1212489 RepID=A0A0W0TC46_9GAMM|nr:hypothetical protein [Legionella drozanskii]KTC93145.1 Regulator of chromosome condensation (RCC1) repeat protein [Legionella drozanskii LLAP-1]
MGRKTKDRKEDIDNNQDNFESPLMQFSLEIYYEMFDKLPISSIVQLRKVNQNLKAFADHYLLRELRVKQIACGQNHTLILLERGRVFSMGSNQKKQSGFIDTNNRTLPTEIIGIDRIESISAGFNHSVLLAKKTIWIMGDNSSQQLAFQPEEETTIALQKLSKIQNVKAMTTSDFITAILDETGRVHRVGVTEGMTTHFFGDEMRLLPDWVPLPNADIDVADISVGKEHALLLDKRGKVYGFGTNQSGELGLGNEIPSCDQWTQLVEEKVSKIKATASGSLILTEAHELKATGINSANQFAPSSEILYQFQTVASDVANFDANDRHTLYLQRDNANILFGMGNNKFGQLGQATKEPKLEEQSEIEKSQIEAQNLQKDASLPAPSLVTHIKHTSTPEVDHFASTLSNKSNHLFFPSMGIELNLKANKKWLINQQEDNWEESEDNWEEEPDEWDEPTSRPGA